MIVPDANLLVYAYDRTAGHHARAREWWEAVLSGTQSVGLPWIVVLAFVRLVTHPTLSTNPMTIDQARERVEEWLACANVVLLVPRETTLARFFDLLRSAGSGGNLSTDALIAAHALEFGGVVYSNDRDFARFSGLQWVNPLEG